MSDFLLNGSHLTGVPRIVERLASVGDHIAAFCTALVAAFSNDEPLNTGAKSIDQLNDHLLRDIGASDADVGRGRLETREIQRARLAHARRQMDI